MNKNNNKGFLLAESLITATFVLTVLIYLFSQFKNLMIEYKNNYRYNCVQDIYNLGSLSKYLTNNNFSSEYGIIYQNERSSLGYNFNSMAQDMEIDYLIFEDSDMEKVKENINEYDSIDQDMIDFIERIKTTKIENKGRLIAKFTNGNFATIVMEKEETP